LSFFVGDMHAQSDPLSDVDEVHHHDDFCLVTSLSPASRYVIGRNFN